MKQGPCSGWPDSLPWFPLIYPAAAVMALALASCLPSPGSRPAAAVDGVLDLTSFDLAANGPVPLAGQWEFSWEGSSEWSIQEVPGDWTAYRHQDRSPPAQGWATYRLLVRTSGAAETLGLRLQSVYSVYRLSVNGTTLGAGPVRDGLPQDVNRGQPTESVFSIPGNSLLEVVLEVRNPLRQRAGIYEPPILGTMGQISRLEHAALGFDFFFLGVMSIVIIYAAAYSLVLKREGLRPLFFALFCAAAGLRLGLLAGEQLLYRLIPISLGMEIRLRALVTYPIFPLGILYVSQVFKEQFLRPLVLALSGGSLLYLLLAWVLPHRIADGLLPAYYPLMLAALGYLAMITYRAYRSRDPDRLEGLCFTLLLAACAVDILRDGSGLTGLAILPGGLLSFILFKAVIIAASSRDSLRVDRDLRIAAGRAAKSVPENPPGTEAVARISPGPTPVEEAPAPAGALVMDGLDLSPLKGRTLLVVEDYPGTRKVIENHVGTAGMRLAFARNGIEAIWLCESAKVDLILMDVHMPEMDGREATRILRRLPLSSNVPIIGMTASVIPEERQACLDHGMNLVLGKPLRRRNLLNALLAGLGYATERPEPLPERPPSEAAGPVDYKTFLAEMNGNKTLVDDLLAGFVSQLEDQLPRLEAALRSGDHERLHREAHSIKGGALNIFAAGLAEAALELEMQARGGGKDLAAALERLRSRAGEVSDFLVKTTRG